jgi:signal transduction histidine kinase
MDKEGMNINEDEVDQDELKLKIDAHVVRQLGEELISDPEQAILELVKNSYDADSPWCSIKIDTTYQVTLNDIFPESEESKESETILKGRILITDRGCGMTRKQIDKGWLTISHSEKRDLKEKKKITEKFNRAYQGDKGLGRLSSMKLGRILKIITSVDGVNGICITLDWDKFQSGCTLDEVPLRVEVLNNLPVGTTIEIVELSSLQHWQGEQAGSRIQSRLSSLLDPFGIEQNFKVSLNIDDKDFPLTSFTKSLIKPTVAQFDYEFNTDFLICKGKVRLPYYLPSEDNSRHDLRAETKYRRYLLNDNGELFLNRLSQKGGKFKNYKLSRSNDKEWFIDFTQKVPWDEMPKDSVPTFQNPNSFKAQWNYFFKKGAIFDLLAKGKLRADEIQALDNLVGVGVYKNDFRVGTNKNDWLGFSSDKTSGRGFYSIRPENVIGYIKFDGYDGEALKEKSDRQGFVENPAYNGFWVVTRAMMAFANDFLNTTRREAIEFVRERVENENGKPENYTGQTAAYEFDTLVERTENAQKHTKKSEEEAKEAFTDAKNSIDSALNDLYLDPKARSEIVILKEKVQRAESKFDTFKTNYAFLENSVLSHKYTTEKIIDSLNDSKSKIEEFYESAAVGLAAENLAHDINPLLDEITLNASNIKSKMMELDLKEKSLFFKINQISSTARVIAKDVSLINPMLRSRRNTISEFTVQEALRDYIELRKEKFESQSLQVNLLGCVELPIKFVRGKFTQILDNLFRNSEYWLNHLGKHTEFKKEIYIEITDSGFSFWDTGPGIYEKMEDILFDMFETGKSNGQGLGLFIISTILNQNSCSIVLLDERNIFERKYKFYVDLSGTLLKS